MEKRDRKTLRQIFDDPAATDTCWIDVEHMFVGMGGYARWADKRDLLVELSGHRASFRTPEDKSSRLDASDGGKLRNFLRSAGVTAADGREDH
jgi:hypothetical protein